MKSAFLGMVCTLVTSALAAYMTYVVVGPPDRSVPCDQGSLPEHYVCLSTVRSWPAEEILWVDARPRADWEKDGLEGSILINDQEDWFDLEFDFMTKMNEAPKPKIVVYCNQSGCGSSKYVANQLREKHAEILGFEVFVLEGGAKALLEQ